jgi:tetratricopeptide (TPR) repeat protein
MTSGIRILAALLVLLLSAPAWCDDVPTAAEVAEKARALVAQGRQTAAEEYLAGFLDEENGPLADNAMLLVEAARLATTAEDCRAYAGRAIERTRSSDLLEAAHMLMGDSYYAENHYLSASAEYEKAARHSSGRGPGVADLKRARSILASGDAGAAVEAFREIADWGATPGEFTPLAEVGLATALLAAGRPAEAAEQFERTARTFPESEFRPKALAGAAESHEAAGEDSAAIAALRRLVADHPDDYEAVLARAHLRTYALRDSAAFEAVEADSAAAVDESAESTEQ